MLEAGNLRRARHRHCLQAFALGREVLPEIGYAECAIGAGQRAGQGLRLVSIGSHKFNAERRDRLGAVRVRVARDRAGRKTAQRVCGNGAHEATTLGAGGAEHSNDFLVRHVALPRVMNWCGKVHW